jgi:hypothetical protein
VRTAEVVTRPFDLVGALLPWSTTRVALGAPLGAPLERVTIEVVSPAEGSLPIVTLGVD